MTRRSLRVVAEQGPACVPTKQRTPVPAGSSFAPLFKVLGDDTRLEILSLLASADEPVCVCDIEAHIRELSQPTISHHLRLLREGGLVTSEKRGTWRYSTLVAGALEPLQAVHRLLVRP